MALAIPRVTDPLAALLALKNDAMQLPGSGDFVSSSVAEGNPALGFQGDPLRQRDQDIFAALSKPFEDEQAAAKAEAAKEAQLHEQYAVPAEIKGKYDVAQEQAKSEGAQALEAAKQKAIDERISQYTSQQPSGGVPGQGPQLSGINAQGEPTFKTADTKMPALIQRAHDQLSDARNKLDMALGEAERLYPGISSEASGVDQTTQAPGWLSFLTGSGMPKYGAASDLTSAANDRLKYSLGIPTPFANLAQSQSFANIEQMAGQLPGVRGLATITPLFKEHQARWGKETPLATVQRLVHMRSIMNDTLHNIESGGDSAETASDPYADENYQPQ